MRLSDIGLPSTIASYYNQTFILPAFQHFLFIQKSKRLQKKSKLCPQKGKQASLKSKSFCAMLRKKRLKCGRIPARLFLACHQKSNIFKCKQFCCAKPMCACLFMGCAPRPRNAVQQYIARGSQLVAWHIRAQTRRSLNECALVRFASQAVPSPVSIGLSNTAARLLKAGLNRADSIYILA